MDGRGNGNMHSIGIEICINRDGNYEKAVQNAVEVTKYLMNKFNIPASRVVRHYDWNKKYCPRQLMNNRSGISWNDFKRRLTSSSSANVSTTSSSSNVSAEPFKGSIVDYLAEIGKPIDFNYRSQLAKEYGISNYKGTAQQNTKLLGLLQAEAEVEDVSYDDSDTPNTQFASVVDYLNAKGQDSSYNNRAKLAKEHGISNYKGTAQQNVELLNKLIESENKSSESRYKSLSKGDTATIGIWATNYQTGEKISAFIKGTPLKVNGSKEVSQSRSKVAYALYNGDTFIGYVLEQDIVEADKGEREADIAEMKRLAESEKEVIEEKTVEESVESDETETVDVEEGILIFAGKKFRIKLVEEE